MSHHIISHHIPSHHITSLHLAEQTWLLHTLPLSLCNTETQQSSAQYDGQPCRPVIAKLRERGLLWLLPLPGLDPWPLLSSPDLVRCSQSCLVWRTAISSHHPSTPPLPPATTSSSHLFLSPASAAALRPLRMSSSRVRLFQPKVKKRNEEGKLFWLGRTVRLWGANFVLLFCFY